MLKLVLVAGAVSLAAACTTSPGRPQEQAKAAGERWLKLVADGQYEEAWEESSVYVKETALKDHWISGLAEASQKRGPVVSRRLLKAEYLPRHRYSIGVVDVVILTYRTTFTNPLPPKEQVSVVRDRDGAWRVYLHLAGLRED